MFTIMSNDSWYNYFSFKNDRVSIKYDECNVWIICYIDWVFKDLSDRLSFNDFKVLVFNYLKDGF